MKIGFLTALNASLLGYIIREFGESNIHIDAIILDPKDVTGKDIRIHQERTNSRLPLIPMYEFEDKHIPFYFVKSHNSDECISLVKKLGIDILVNAGTMRILKQSILNAPSIGVVNCHPGMLPFFRGCTCVEWAIYLDKQVGNTVHFMSEGIDEGPIILQEGLTFFKNDTYVDIRVKVYRHSIAMLAKGIKKIVNENLTPSKLLQQGEGTYYGVIEPDKMQIVLEKLKQGKYAFQY